MNDKIIHGYVDELNKKFNEMDAGLVTRISICATLFATYSLEMDIPLDIFSEFLDGMKEKYKLGIIKKETKNV